MGGRMDAMDTLVSAITDTRATGLADIPQDIVSRLRRRLRQQEDTVPVAAFQSSL
jgi:FXSXX-COOH protein